MRIYLAGSASSNPEKIGWERMIHNRLLSFFDKPKLGAHWKNRNLFLDSGAYSAKSKGVTISLDAYMQFIEDNKEYITIYPNLDVIGDVKGTWRNQRIMERNGFSPLPVFHIMEPVKYLHRCIDKYPYFCIGGTASGYGSTERTQFLDYCFSEINRIGKEVKVHGFGVTSFSLMNRYPWHSVDSTYWLMTGITGKIFVPNKINGRFSYKKPYTCVISDDSPQINIKGAHYNSYPPLQKKIIQEYLESIGYVLGESEWKNVEKGYVLNKNEKFVDSQKLRVKVILKEGVVNSYLIRNAVNISFFNTYEKLHSQEQFKINKQNTLFI